jgi:predicted phage terminase large subunit-like protein
MLKLAEIIKKFGIPSTAAWFQEKIKKPQNFWLYSALDTEAFSEKTPQVHKDIIARITDNYRSPIKGKHGIHIPRGGGKSTLISKKVEALAVTGQIRFILYISDTFSQAKLHVGAIKASIESNRVLNMFIPGVIGDKWGEEGIVVNGLFGDCFIMPLGAGMKVRGLKYKAYRPGLIVLDDVENLEAVYSEERRAKLKNWFDYDLMRAMDKKNNNIVFIGTILHHYSLLNQILKGEGAYQGWNRYHVKGLSENDTKSFWPEMYPVQYLKDIRDNPNSPDYVGSRVFAQEIQGVPQDDKDRIIKSDWIKYYNFGEERKKTEAENDQKRLEKLLNKYERVGAFDPAISEKESADYSALYAFGFDKLTAREDMFDVKRFKEGDINKQVKEICDFIINWKLQKFGIETVAYQSGLSRLVKQELNRRAFYQCKVTKLKTDKDKIRRAKIHSSGFEAGFIRFRSDHPGTEELVKEILGFPLEKNDDQIDALMLARETRKKHKARIFAKKPKQF